MLVSIKERNVYGNTLLYPNNETAQKFADLVNKKTFTTIDLEKIKSLGYQIELIKL